MGCVFGWIPLFLMKGSFFNRIGNITLKRVWKAKERWIDLSWEFPLV